ncbi:uncharacterized protein [Macaca fascicularis]|uniref:uncharacterized protein n=1 Tax=Macaca fascicularis TaxID=9541 RepID=UPI003D15EA2C
MAAAEEGSGGAGPGRGPAANGRAAEGPTQAGRAPRRRLEGSRPTVGPPPPLPPAWTRVFCLNCGASPSPRRTPGKGAGRERPREAGSGGGDVSAAAAECSGRAGRWQGGAQTRGAFSGGRKVAGALEAEGPCARLQPLRRLWRLLQASRPQAAWEGVLQGRVRRWRPVLGANQEGIDSSVPTFGALAGKWGRPRTPDPSGGDPSGPGHGLLTERTYQQLLQVLLTTEERQQVLLEARKNVPGPGGLPTQLPNKIDEGFPLTRPDWDYETAPEAIVRQPPDRWITNARLTHYQALLLDMDRVQFGPPVTLNPATLLPVPEDQPSPHDCRQVLAETHGTQEDLKDQELPDADHTWYTDGSNYLDSGSAKRTPSSTGPNLGPLSRTVPTRTSTDQSPLPGGRLCLR